MKQKVARKFRRQRVGPVGHFEGGEQLAAALRGTADLIEPRGEFEMLADG